MFQINSKNTQKKSEIFKNSILSQTKQQVYMFFFLPQLKVSLTLSSDVCTELGYRVLHVFWGGYLEIPYFPLSSPKVQGVFQKVEATASFEILCL